MKSKFIHCLLVVGLIGVNIVSAQTFVNPSLKELSEEVNAKLKTNLPTEALLAPEFVKFDALIAAQKGAKNEAAAEVIYMKGLLYLEVLNDLDKGSKILSELTAADYPTNRYTLVAAKICDQIKHLNAARKIQESLAVGVSIPDFNETNLMGAPLSIANYKGKVVLLEFWATWCVPCRVELPNIVAAYKKYHPQGFEVIGVTLDLKRSDVEKFLSKNADMVWPQYFDTELEKIAETADRPGLQFENKLARKYGVEIIPNSILIGRDGKIIAKSLRGDALMSEIAKAVEK